MKYSFHNKYKKISPWWKFIRQEFELLEPHTERGPVWGYEYEDDQVKLTANGFITAKVGFRWGASGPTIDTKSSRRASCFHDAYFYLSDKGIFKGARSKKILNVVNLYMHQMMIQDGMWEYRANAWFNSLDKFSHYAWESEGN